MAYNPNDCVELRWAAAEGSDEGATSKRRQPRPRSARQMSSDYRVWFRERHWPAHGWGRIRDDHHRSINFFFKVESLRGQRVGAKAPPAR